MIEATAKLKNARISPKKARLVANAIRGLSVSDALVRLPVIFKQSAPMIDKLLKSAVANAQDQYEVKAEDLLIKSIIVNKGMDLKRWQPAAFGRAHPFKKHFSHIEIVVVGKEGIKGKQKEKSKEVETIKLSEVDKAEKKVEGKISAKNGSASGGKKDKKTDKADTFKSTQSKQSARIDKHTTNK